MLISVLTSSYGLVLLGFALQFVTLRPDVPCNHQHFNVACVYEEDLQIDIFRLPNGWGERPDYLKPSELVLFSQLPKIDWLPDHWDEERRLDAAAGFGLGASL
ncbi:MAG: hypothetical protein AAF585_05260 [Verrucomicrobiota bacterium]